MAMTIAIMGESGSGKTTAMRNLPPESTMYVDADQKGLSWRGWRTSYNKENRNYVRTSNKETIIQLFERIQNEKEFAHIKYVIVDTINGIMVDDEMSRMKEKGYDKWADLAFAVYGLITYALKMREDLTVIFLAHAQAERDDNGNMWTHIKTSGKKLDKIVLESKFTTVLYSRCIDGEHVFETHANNSTAKTPLGAFEEMTVANDIVEVLKKLEEFR